MRSDHKTKRSRGSFTVELPGVLFVLFMLLVFPLLNLATVTLRYTYLLEAARDAAHLAAQAKTFLVNADSNNQSAVNTAQSRINLTADSYTGVTFNSVITRIRITNIANHTVTTQTTPLATPADTNVNYYAIEVVINGSCQPLLSYTDGLGNFFNIPGLTSPMTYTVSSQEMCENTQGLTQ